MSSDTPTANPATSEPAAGATFPTTGENPTEPKPTHSKHHQSHHPKRPRKSDGHEAHGRHQKKHTPHASHRQEATVDPNNPYLSMFTSFRDELDAHHDLRERVIKTSRDVTALSKKMIFTLQRTRKLGQPLPENLQTEIDGRLEEIKKLLTTIAPDLQSLNRHRYSRQLSGGLQELVEALLFKHYLQTTTLLPYETISSTLPENVHLSASDYLLGVYDFTGELMRIGVTLVALRSGEGERVLEDLRATAKALEGVEMGGGGVQREAEKKAEVMRACVAKVEGAVYGVVVRGSERPEGWVPETEVTPVGVEV